MSALIRQMVIRRRAAVAGAQAEAARVAALLASAKGDPGEQRAEGSKGDMPDHEWQGTRLRFQKPDGRWGEFVDLRGQKGRDGRSVVLGGGGRRFDPATLAPAAAAPAPEEFLVQQNGALVRATWAQLVGWIGGLAPSSPGVLVGSSRVMSGRDRVVVEG